jgi:DNA modification methylase
MSRARGVEIVWPGKAESAASRRVTDVLDGQGAQASEELCPRLELVERVEPARLAGAGPRAPALEAGEPARARNVICWGDNLDALCALHAELAGKVHLIYIDPPYATGLSYYAQSRLGDGGPRIERRAYRDARHLGDYLEHLWPRLRMMHALLAADGALFLHCDWRASAAVRLVLDEVFGAACFRNEIVWRRAPNLGRQAASRQLGRVFDSIFVYSKTPGAAFRGTPPRLATEVPLDRDGKPRGARWDPERRAYFTTAPRGDYTDASIARLRTEGRVLDVASGKVYIKYFLRRADDGRWIKEQPADALWDDPEVRPLRHCPKSEDRGYDTQKPEGLLRRIVAWASRPGDLVADFYCGSGTAPAVAEALGRSWIACDASPAAIAVTRRRLLEMRALGRPARPCELRSTLRAARVRWAAPLRRDGAEGDAARVLEAFGARPLEGRSGARGEARVWVAPPEVALGETHLREACREARAAGARRLDVLGWDFEAALDAARARALARAEHGVALRIFTVPDEIATAPVGGARRCSFPERPEMDVELLVRDGGRCVVRLGAVRCSDPRVVRGRARKLAWPALVDGWAVDWKHARTFCARWWSHQNGGALALETPPFELGRAARVCVRLSTVFGDEIFRVVGLD